MALESVNPPSENILNDGDDKSMAGADLEDGEIEDGEIPEGAQEAAVPETKPEEKQKQEKIVSPPKLEPPVIDAKMVLESKIHNSSHKTHSNKKHPNRNSSRKFEHVERNVGVVVPEVEDDWACDVEKAIRAQMAKELGQNPEKESDNNDEVVQDELKTKRRKRKRKHRAKDEDDKGESKVTTKKRRKTHQRSTSEMVNAQEPELEEDEDDDEMLFVRGASPIMRNTSPTPSYPDEGYSYPEPGPYDEPFDSGCDESEYDDREDFLPRRGARGGGDEEGPKRGSSRGMKRRHRGGRGGLLSKRLGRKDLGKNKRGGNKRQQRVVQEKGPDSVCMFYMQGKCQKGEECPYSHDAKPPRKMELCKFYLMDCCAKKDKCLYMHNDFPCKFYHTGLKCFSGDRCKFSHGQLNDALRAILLKHLETAPKEILGDFPRLTREGAAAMVYNKKKSGGDIEKKIPSLFDIEVPIPPQFLEEKENANHSPSRRSTPMPESDNEDHDIMNTPDMRHTPDNKHTPQSGSPKTRSSSRGRSRRWDDDDTSPYHHQGRNCHDEEDSDARRPFYMDQDFDEQLHQIKPFMKFYQDTLITSEGEGEKISPEEKGEKEPKTAKRELNLHRFAGYSPNQRNLDEGNWRGEEQESVEKQEDLKSADEPKDDSLSQEESAIEKMEVPLLETGGESGTESSDGSKLPLHLPKKQRELFLRIQQQQREADSSQDQSGNNDENGGQQVEENWYSSDEEGTSLTDMLKNLSKQQASKAAPENVTPAAPRTPSPPPPAPATFDKLTLSDLSQINISESVSKLLSSIRHNVTPGTTVAEGDKDLRVPPSLPSPQTSQNVARDPRLLNRDPRNRGAAAQVSPSPSTDDVKDTRPVDDKRSRAAVSSSRRGSSTSTPSIYSAGDVDAPPVDVDLRSFLSKHEHRDVDLRTLHPGGDVDFRPACTPTVGYGDTDLRVSNDVDLRNMLGLPFKPVPMHTPATEIDASLTSHPPIPYKVVTVTIPRPDYTHLKLNTSDPQVQNDPRLRKILRLSPVASSTGLSLGGSPPPKSRIDPRRQVGRAGPPSQAPMAEPLPATTGSDPFTDPTLPHAQNTLLMHGGVMSGVMPSLPVAIQGPLVPNFDPRIPRNPRNAPGLLGPAPLPFNFCPNTPRFEENEDNSNGSDTDFRRYFGNQMNQGDVAMWEHQQQNVQGPPQQPRHRSWRGRRRNRFKGKKEYSHNHKSYTPPL